MSTPHFLVFVGASASLSTELAALRPRFANLEVIAPAAAKNERGLTDAAIRRSIEALQTRLGRDATHDQPARLTVWAYGPDSPAQFEALWKSFGKSAWVELLPSNLMHKDRLTRLHVEDRLLKVSDLLHEISHHVYNLRKQSLLPLPLLNFRSQLVTQIDRYWYNDADVRQLKELLSKLAQRFKQAHTTEERKLRDDRSLVFGPAKNEECHGRPHPTGSGGPAFVNGRFRFGAALFPGFHYDVSATSGALTSTLYDSDGSSRNMAPEKRNHVNIFPNDHILPKRAS